MLVNYVLVSDVIFVLQLYMLFFYFLELHVVSQ